MKGDNLPDLNILAAYPIFTRKYGITMSQDDFLEEAYIAFKEINSIPVKYYYFIAKPDNKDSMIIQLPCNLHRIISVSSAPANPDNYKELEPYMLSAEIRDGEQNRLDVIAGNSDIKTYHFDDKPYTGLGSYIQFEWESDEAIRIIDGRLWDSEIHIVYDGIAVDETGLPLITLKHAKAIAAKVAVVYATRKMFAGDQVMAQIVPTITQESMRLTQAAAIPEHITDNELDEFLNEFTRMDRKRYNRSFKFRRG